MVARSSSQTISPSDRIMATAAVKRTNRTTSKKLFRLLAAIRSRKVVVMEEGPPLAA